MKGYNIEDRDVPFLQNWDNCLALTEKKLDLAQFLLNKLIEWAPPDKLFAVSGEFGDKKDVGCSRQVVNVSALRATHDKKDVGCSRQDVDVSALRATHNDVATLIVSVRDTDVLLLLLS